MAAGPEPREPDAADLILKATLRETRATLAEWNRHPLRTLNGWLLVSFSIAAAMLLAVLGVAHLATPDYTTHLPNITTQSHIADAVRVFFRNVLVLALHGFVCLAGFMAMRALPEQTKYKSGINRWAHEHAGPFAMIFVSAATIFSITTQTFILGYTVADISLTLGISNATLLVTVLPHALLELTAIFLPLAAFLSASRRKRWDELLAATIVTVSLALPALVIAGFIEAYVWPSLLRGILF